mmetsp:Transcript_13992/g.28654  ORF Transcript_13992/g.28654 Transcript_13992/m.28654 type:complete len:124 (-) Transcript_13992:191-562(-)
MAALKWIVASLVALFFVNCYSVVVPKSEKLLSSSVGWYENTYYFNFPPAGYTTIRQSCPSGREATACSCWADITKGLQLMACDPERYLGPGGGPGKITTCQAYYRNPSQSSNNVRIAVKAYCQ